MKKRLLFAFLIMASALVAQPTFNSQDIFSVGTTYDKSNVNPGLLNTSVTGANSNWDYSSLNSASNTHVTADVITNQYDHESFNMSSFVMADVVGTDSIFKYYSISSGSLALDGFTSVSFGIPFPPAPLGPMIYNPGVDVFRFPSTFNTAFTQEIMGKQVVPLDTVRRRGIQTVTFDGYGTLTTPEGTFNDVLRFFTNQTYTDSSTGQGLFATWEVQSLTWISAETMGIPLLKKETVSRNGAQVESTAFYTDAGSVGINKTGTSVFNVFPNPADDMIFLTGNANGGKLSAELYSLTGQMISSLYNVNTAAGQVQVQLPVDQTAPGMYLIKINNGGNSSVKKIVIR